MKVKKAKRDPHTGEKKKKKNREQNAEVEIDATVESVDSKCFVFTIITVLFGCL